MLVILYNISLMSQNWERCLHLQQQALYWDNDIWWVVQKLQSKTKHNPEKGGFALEKSLKQRLEKSFLHGVGNTWCFGTRVAVKIHWWRYFFWNSKDCTETAVQFLSEKYATHDLLLYRGPLGQRTLNMFAFFLHFISCWYECSCKIGIFKNWGIMGFLVVSWL